MSLRLLLQTIWRETRGAPGRMFFLCACIAVGVSAVVGVAGMVEAIERGLRAQSRELLGGDLALESRRPLPEVLPYVPRDYRVPAPPPIVEMRILTTMVRTGESGKSRLAEVKAVDRLARQLSAGGAAAAEARAPAAGAAERRVGAGRARAAGGAAARARRHPARGRPAAARDGRGRARAGPTVLHVLVRGHAC